MGELDLATAPALEETLRNLSGEGEGPVIVDLMRCGFIDLRGLHVLLGARERLERSNRALALVVGTRILMRVFKITRVDDLFDFYPSRAAADKANGVAVAKFNGVGAAKFNGGAAAKFNSVAAGNANGVPAAKANGVAAAEVNDSG